MPGIPVPKGRHRARVSQPKGGRPRGRQTKQPIHLPDSGEKPKPYAQFYTPAETRNYETAVGWRARAVMRKRPPLDCAIRVDVTAYVPVPASWPQTRKRRALDGDILPTARADLDNLVKAALDGCNKIVFRDDALITTQVARKRYAREPQLVITVRPDD